MFIMFDRKQPGLKSWKVFNSSEQKTGSFDRASKIRRFCGLQDFQRFFFWETTALEIGWIQLHHQHETILHALSDLTYNLQQQSPSFLCAATIFISAAVSMWWQKAGEQVAMRTMHLDPIESGLLSPLGRGGKTFHHILDLHRRHLPWLSHHEARHEGWEPRHLQRHLGGTQWLTAHRAWTLSTSMADLHDGQASAHLAGLQKVCAGAKAWKSCIMLHLPTRRFFFPFGNWYPTRQVHGGSLFKSDTNFTGLGQLAKFLQRRISFQHHIPGTLQITFVHLHVASYACAQTAIGPNLSKPLVGLHRLWKKTLEISSLI